LQGIDLSTVLSGTFRLSLTRNGPPLFSLPATVGGPPTYASQTATFVALFYAIIGGEFGTTTGNYWVSLLLNLSSGGTVEVEPDVIPVTTPWGQQ
jgi:hypothetical protein